jgi:hypothetical protein
MSLLSALAQIHPNSGPDQPSPETLKALAEILKAVGGGAHDSPNWLTPAGLTAIATLISSIAWPLVVLTLALVLTPQLRAVLLRITEFEFFGIKGKIQSELEQSARAAQKSQGLSTAPTAGEQERAIQVERLASNADLALVRRQVDELASEYERVRSSMPPGNARTRRMEVVVSKMRPIGRAAYPLRHELSSSSSPGWRLQAIASLQVAPDYDLLEWLVDRVNKERPFVSYHALVAINVAARDERAHAHLPALSRALARVLQETAALGRDTDRVGQVKAFKAQVEHLRQDETAEPR